MVNLRTIVAKNLIAPIAEMIAETLTDVEGRVCALLSVAAAKETNPYAHRNAARCAQYSMPLRQA